MGRQKTGVSGQNIPFPAGVTDKQTAAATVTVAPADPVVLGTVQIPGGDVDKVIHFTGELVSDVGGENVTFMLYRGAAELAVTDRYTQLAPNSRELVHMHWYDANPGPGQVTYSVRAIGDVGGQTDVESRRTTVEHAG